MGIFDLFSKRQNKLRGEVPDVYTYDIIPQPLRVQIIHIWNDTLGDIDDYRDSYKRSYSGYKLITETLCREYGVFSLLDFSGHRSRDYYPELCHFLLTETDTEKVMDAIELSFRVIDKMTRDYEYLRSTGYSERADAAISELNGRFKEHGVGFQYIDGEIIRIDSELIHTQVVKPALMLLHDARFKGAQDEFLTAYEHYRHGNAKEALTECLKALESTMKAICDKRKWKYLPNATCNSLIELCVKSGLIPEFWMQQFTSLRSTLETGVAPARNKLGGHGQGSAVVEVPQHITAYVLHMTAAGIVFLVESEKALSNHGK
jgi:hypothetical protein